MSVRHGRQEKVPPRKMRPADFPEKAVFLVGFMGAGKTSVGRTLAQLLNWTFEDLDDRIVKCKGRAIAEIFRDYGEPAFREAEHESLRQVLEEVSAEPGKIVALGGGAFAQQKNSALVRAAGVPTILLDAPVEELWRRCREQAANSETERPLLKDRDVFHELYRARRRAYTKASVRIATSGRTVEEIAGEIARVLGLKKREIRSEQGEVQ